MKVLSIIVLLFSLSSVSLARGKGTYGGDKDYNMGSSFTFDSSYTHEISTNLTQGNYVSSKACSKCSTGSNLTLGAGYLHSWQNEMQYGFEASLTNTTGLGTGLTLLGVGTYNLSHDFKNAVYFKGGLGVYSVLSNTSSSYDSKLGFFMGVGKRFTWISNVAFNPELRIVKRGDLDFEIHAALMNFSIFWN